MFENKFVGNSSCLEANRCSHDTGFGGKAIENLRYYPTDTAEELHTCTRVLYIEERTSSRYDRERDSDESSMSCLNTRYKLITLCCCITLIALISSIMVINAFLRWSSTSELHDTTTPAPATTLQPDAVHTQFPMAINNYGLDIQINIHEITTSSTGHTQTRHKWLEVDSGTHSDDEDFIDIDRDINGEFSGSGLSDDIENSEQDIIVPLPTTSTTTRRPAERTTPTVLGNGESIITHTHSPSSGSNDGKGVSSYHIGSPVTQPSLPDEDKCNSWLRCEDPFLKEYVEKFKSLPSCPCRYPLLGINGIYDEKHKKIFKWKDSGYSFSYLLAYYQGAEQCIRTEVIPGTLAAQNCCYDKSGQLITRGSGAGTPDLISPDVSAALHQLIDKMPWILCRGDWTKYNVARPPNNARLCADNPMKMEYVYQIWLAKNQ